VLETVTALVTGELWEQPGSIATREAEAGAFEAMRDTEGTSLRSREPEECAGMGVEAGRGISRYLCINSPSYCRRSEPGESMLRITNQYNNKEKELKIIIKTKDCSILACLPP